MTFKGTKMDASQPDVEQDWAPGYPIVAAGPAVIMADSMQWHNAPTNTPVNSVVCAKNSGYTYDNETGKYYRFESSRWNYNSAEQICIMSGGNMAITNGPTYPRQLMQKFYNMNGTFWIGGLIPLTLVDVWGFRNGERFKKNEV